MTQQKHLKSLVREAMTRSGLRYAAARRAVLARHQQPQSPHRAGNVPGATALRVLLAGIQPDLSEELAFGLGGGIGVGVFAFFYEREKFASFFVAGRHLWHDEEMYLSRAIERLGLKPEISETTSPKTAGKNLAAMLAEHGPCVAWVDMAGLPHRGLPKTMMGGGYHIITVYSVEESAGTALIGDLTDDPITISMADLTAARGRIKKDKYRLLAVAASKGRQDLPAAVASALRACLDGFAGADAPKSARRNFTLDALVTWADRLTSTTDKDRWERVFEPGRRFWDGLNSVHKYIEYYGTGGGLCRPLMADFLEEAARILRKPAIGKLSAEYAALGHQWSDLADAALPESVPAFDAARKLHARAAELFHSGGTIEEKQACSAELADLADKAAQRFPLSDAECAALRADLSDRVRALHAAEVAALDHLRECVK